MFLCSLALASAQLGRQCRPLFGGAARLIPRAPFDNGPRAVCANSPRRRRAGGRASAQRDRSIRSSAGRLWRALVRPNLWRDDGAGELARWLRGRSARAGLAYTRAPWARRAPKVATLAGWLAAGSAASEKERAGEQARHVIESTARRLASSSRVSKWRNSSSQWSPPPPRAASQPASQPAGRPADCGHAAPLQSASICALRASQICKTARRRRRAPINWRPAPMREIGRLA